MKEIKFRAWCISGERKEMIYFDLDTALDLWDATGGGMMPHRKSIMQYTGLKDSLGNEIWEGDIVSVKEYREKPYNCVIEKDIYAMAGYSPFNDEMGPSWDDVEVIGNIYENSELIEDSNEH